MQNPVVSRVSRFQFLDFLKTIAANLIVLHHLAFYGPMTDRARPLLPNLMDWLQNHARIAVQVFLVIAGFLAARSLSPQARPGLRGSLLGVVLRRYIKLAPPFIMAMLFAIAASELARVWMAHDSISAPAAWPQFWAHVFLLHSVLDVESLSAGVWYIAIDFQLYAMLAMLLWAAGKLAYNSQAPLLVPLLTTGCVAASLFHFNLDADWDVWAPYFFGSYGMGVLAWWAVNKRKHTAAALLAGAILLLGGLALEMEFRSRIAVALATALLLVMIYRGEPLLAGRQWPLMRFFGRISYSLFLVHFPVCLVVNAAFTRFLPAEPALQMTGVLLAWLASIAAGALFQRWVEAPLAQLSNLSLFKPGKAALAA